MRERRCPQCHTVWRGRAARWCGRCGAALPGPRRTHHAGRAFGRLVAAVVAALLTAGAIAVVQGGCCPGRPSPRQDLVAVGAPPPVPTTGVRLAASKAIGGGLLVIADRNGVVATDAATGARVFASALDDLGLDTAVTGSEHAVSVRAYDGGVVLASGPTTTALAGDGAQRWRLDSDGVLATRIVVADRERIVLVGSHRDGTDRLQVVRTTDGGLRFVRPIAGLIAVEEQTALVREAGQDVGVTAVSLLDGTVRWASLPSSAADGDG